MQYCEKVFVLTFFQSTLYFCPTWMFQIIKKNKKCNTIVNTKSSFQMISIIRGKSNLNPPDPVWKGNILC